MIANFRNVMFRNCLSYNMIYFQSVSLFVIAVFFDRLAMTTLMMYLLWCKKLTYQWLIKRHEHVCNILFWAINYGKKILKNHFYFYEPYLQYFALNGKKKKALKSEVKKDLLAKKL